MKMSRRELLKAGIGAGASVFFPAAGLRAQAIPLIQRKIPSTGESVPIIGLGTARRYEEIKTETEKAPLRVVLYRRMMLLIAESIARREKASALVTGESLAQVASQTLENMTVIEKAAGLSILRPLVGMDKQEIIDQARRIGTFETSAIPDQDCCQLFVPKHPATKARLADVEDAESRLDLAAMIQLGVEKGEKEEFKFP